MKNYFKIQLPAIGENESFARSILSSFVLSLSPTIEEINDLKTAISEAVTNCVVHAYNKNDGVIEISAEINENLLSVTISDFGKGIADIEKAKTPMYTSGGDERSGMGFTIMETFMDTLEVSSKLGEGTSVTMTKTFGIC
ncbi:MAG: anti-sigma F factor [Clostridia bacterium]|nr:anti-sigma F factor [Clostridia bacterium]